MDINKKSAKSNNTPFVIALIIVPVLFVFGTMIIIAMVMTTNRPTIKLTLSEPTNITDNSANFSVNIEGDKDKIKSKGFVYGTDSNPEIKSRTNNSSPFYDLFNYYSYSYDYSDFYIEMSEDKNNATVEDLLPETKYYVRAYAMTGYGTTYSNELSFMTKDWGTNFQDDDVRRRGDVRLILNGLISLRRERPDIFNNENGVYKNIRTSGYEDCYSSTIKDSDSVLYFELESIGYYVPEDPMSKTYGCSDYAVSISSDNITVTAPNAEYGPISVSSAER